MKDQNTSTTFSSKQNADRDITMSKAEMLALQEKLEAIQEQIIQTVLEYDHIRLQANKQLNHQYMISIGCWEQQRIYEDLQNRKAKRRFELANTYANRGMPIDMETVEKRLRDELQQWQAKLDISMREYQGVMADNRSRKFLCESDSREISRLYKTLMKRLHPDLNPHLNAREQQLFYVAQSAYEEGQLDILRSLAAATEHLQKEEAAHHFNDDAEAIHLEAELTIAQEVLQNCITELKRLKESFPYELKDKLFDSEWISEKIRKIKQDIEQLKEARHHYERKLEIILA